jgi:hypothetical protein
MPTQPLASTLLPLAEAGGWLLLQWIGRTGWAADVHVGVQLFIGLQVFDGLLRGVWGVWGVQVPRMCNHPYAATSLSDFWSKRWNSMIQELLYREIYSPCRLKLRLPKAVCVATTFAASGLMHCYPLVVAGADHAALLSTMGYFAVHCAAVLLEEGLTVAVAKVGDHASLFGWMCRAAMVGVHLATISMIVQPFRGLVADV